MLFALQTNVQKKNKKKERPIVVFKTYTVLIAQNTFNISTCVW